MRTLILLLTAGASFAAGPVTETHTYDLAANATIELKDAGGDVSIEAWDQPRVELTVTKNAPDPKLLEKIKVTAEGGGNTLTIASSYPKYPKIERPFRWILNFDLDYRIKAPKTAKLVIDDYSGQVNVSGMSGDIRANDRNGDIFLLMPDGSYAVRARTKIGPIVSDFPGKQKRSPLLFGYDFVGSSETGSRLDLTARTGTITVLKMRKPVSAD